MSITRARELDSSLTEQNVNSLSKKYHNLFRSYDILIEQCDDIKNPALRIQELKNLHKKIVATYREINNYLRKIPALKKNALIVTTKKELLDNLKDLRSFEYQQHKKDLIHIFTARIRAKLSDAAIENTFDQTFYVYQNSKGQETNTPKSAYHYFWGIPEKDQSKFFYILDWLSYIGGGFLIIPLKNALKWTIEFLPNLFMTFFYNNIKQLQYQTPSSNIFDILANTLAFGLFKILHVLGRTVTSPLTSAKIGFQWGFDICQSLPTENNTIKKIAGVLLGSLFALPSLATGLATIIMTILFLPNSIIWVVGKIPVVGAQGAAWLTSVGETLGSLRLVDQFASNNFKIATKMAPAFATLASEGISAFTQFILFGQKALKLLGLIKLSGEKLLKFFEFIKKTEPKPTKNKFSPPVEFETVPRSSYKLMQKQGLLAERDEEKLIVHNPLAEEVVPLIPSSDSFEVQEDIVERDAMGSWVNSPTFSR